MGRSKRTLLMAMGYTVYDRVRRRIASDHNWRCVHCEMPVNVKFNAGDQLATIDHDVPLSRGGNWKRYNLACACKMCNHDKENMTHREYRFYRYLIRGHS